jgi:hypothetical protein
MKIKGENMENLNWKRVTRKEVEEEINKLTRKGKKVSSEVLQNSAGEKETFYSKETFGSLHPPFAKVVEVKGKDLTRFYYLLK